MPDNTLLGDDAADAELAGRQSFIFLLGEHATQPALGPAWSRATSITKCHPSS
jgi:hypothetical protein